MQRLALLIALLWLVGRSNEAGPRLFKQLTPNQTGVTFANTITTNDSLNVQSDVYVYNGGGVAIGDIDNDGLQDIFLTGNMVSSGLYLNKGNMRFEDITESPGVKTDRWASGASMVDINNGYRTFTEAASRYGIAEERSPDDPAHRRYVAECNTRTSRPRDGWRCWSPKDSGSGTNHAPSFM